VLTCEVVTNSVSLFCVSERARRGTLGRRRYGARTAVWRLPAAAGTCWAAAAGVTAATESPSGGTGAAATAPTALPLATLTAGAAGVTTG